MFTGIIESVGKVTSLKRNKDNLTVEVEAPFTKELKIGDSVAHNGVCLTIETIYKAKKLFSVTAIKETLAKTNLGLLGVGSFLNLERSLKVGDRLDGHFVQGHVDCTAKVTVITSANGSTLFEFEIDRQFKQASKLIIDKGSICINGVSLTIVKAKKNIFSVAIIPHTFSETNFHLLRKENTVNLEFDVLGKYIQKIISSKY